MTTFLLLRHAAHDWVGRGFAGRLPEVSLNAQGQEEAKDLVRRLDGQPVDAIYCSPQPRTHQTVRPLAEHRGLVVHTEAAFDEVDLGEWQGRTFDEVRGQEAWRHWLEHRSTARPPGGEPFAGVPVRAMEGMRRLAARHPAAHVLVCSHGDVLKAIIATALGSPLDNLERFDIAPAAISVLAMEGDWVQLQLLNARGPLR